MVQTYSITVPSMVGIVGCSPAEDKKTDVFLFVFVILRNYEVFDNGNTIKQCNVQNDYLLLVCMS